MARLIVEEGGRRRAFKVGDGVLTIGSGSDARLRVAAPDVAEVHAELQVTGSRAVLRPRPGVVSPAVGGAPVGAEAEVAYGEEIRIGSVRLWLEDEEAPAGGQAPAPAAAPASADARPAVPAAGAVRAELAARRERAIAEAKRRGDRSVVQRTAPRSKSGVPAVVILPLVLGGLAVVGFGGWRLFRRSVETAPRAGAILDAVEEHVVDGSFDLALTKLDSLPPDLSTEERARADALRADVARARQQIEADLENAVGTQFVDVKLVRYEEIYLQGNPSRARIREFLERCREFRMRWPNHPQRDWVARQERRFEGVVDLAAPPTIEDVEWKVECLTRTNPKDFKRALSALDSFLASASGAEADAAAALRETLFEERRVNHLDRMQQAKYEYQQKGDVAQAVRELVNAIVYNGDEEMTAEAAGILVRIENVEPHLAGYKAMKPALYAELVQEPTVARFVEERGI